MYVNLPNSSCFFVAIPIFFNSGSNNNSLFPLDGSPSLTIKLTATNSGNSLPKSNALLKVPS